VTLTQSSAVDLVPLRYTWTLPKTVIDATVTFRTNGAAVKITPIFGFTSTPRYARRAKTERPGAARRILTKVLVSWVRRVLQVTEAMIHIAGDRKTYEEAFDTKLITEERPVVKP
jgi:hypothetical protein